MNRIALAALLPLIWAASAQAQPMDPNMKGMSMPAAKSAPAKTHTATRPASTKPAAVRRRVRHKPRMAGMAMPASRGRRAALRMTWRQCPG